MKRLGLYIFIGLFLISIYKDLTTGLLPENTTEQTDENRVEKESLTGIRAEVDKGDTVLSVVEKINEQLGKVDIPEIRADFKTLNPHTDPLRIESGEYYYFPLYEKGAE